VTALIGAALIGAADTLALPEWQWPGLGLAGAAALTALGALLALTVSDRLVLLLIVGLIGYGSALIFVFAGAPDVAFTQFTVETVFVIVAASVLLKLKRMGRARSVREPWLRPGAMAMSIAFGAVTAALVLVVAALPFDPALSDYFGRVSVPEAFGRNVVNVVLVDFRALDTLGEIAVVMLSLLAAMTLLSAARDHVRPRKAPRSKP
jgi:multicomponent Na+:H+ antiporter subunit A